jgi:hypothetical protein
MGLTREDPGRKSQSSITITIGAGVSSILFSILTFTRLLWGCLRSCRLERRAFGEADLDRGGGVDRRWTLGLERGEANFNGRGGVDSRRTLGLERRGVGEADLDRGGGVDLIRTLGLFSLSGLYPGMGIRPGDDFGGEDSSKDRPLTTGLNPYVRDIFGVHGHLIQRLDCSIWCRNSIQR